MVERFGVKGTEVDGVFFTESAIPSGSVVGHIHAEISRQNANLFEIKKEMASKATNAGASTIMNFRYGQKAHAWWELVFTFKWDTESWHGEGDIVKI